MTARLRLPKWTKLLVQLLEADIQYRMDVQVTTSTPWPLWTPLGYFALYQYVDMLLGNQTFMLANRYNVIRVMRRRWVWSKWSCVFCLDQGGCQYAD